jgi:hypothetical protein
VSRRDPTLNRHLRGLAQLTVLLAVVAALALVWLHAAGW